MHKRDKDDVLTGDDVEEQPRGYAFVEFEKEEDMRARGVPSCGGHAFNSCPSHDDVGGFFFDFEAIRTVS